MGLNTQAAHWIYLNKPLHLPAGMPFCASEEQLKYWVQQMPNGCQHTSQDVPAWWVDSGLIGFLGMEGGAYAILRIQTDDAPDGVNVYVPSGAVYNAGDQPKD